MNLKSRFDHLIDKQLRLLLVDMRTLMAMTDQNVIPRKSYTVSRVLYAHLMFHGRMLEAIRGNVNCIAALIMHQSEIMDITNTLDPEEKSGEEFHRLVESIKSQIVCLVEEESELMSEVVEF